MNFDQFISSLGKNIPPDNLTALLVALWWEKKGDWTQAHKITQKIHTKDAALVHAYLHRREGDLSNANYWYRTAGKSAFNGSMEEEWGKIVNCLIKQLN